MRIVIKRFTATRFAVVALIAVSSQSFGRAKADAAARHRPGRHEGLAFPLQSYCVADRCRAELFQIARSAHRAARAQLRSTAPHIFYGNLLRSHNSLRHQPGDKSESKIA
jgi:hypothetical protein